jgi:hypothetical protein
MADTDMLEALEEIDAATERARECGDHMWQLVADLLAAVADLPDLNPERDRVRRVAADSAFELVQALRHVSDETSGLRVLLAGAEYCPVAGENPLDRIDPAGGRS